MHQCPACTNVVSCLSCLGPGAENEWIVEQQLREAGYTRVPSEPSTSSHTDCSPTSSTFPMAPTSAGGKSAVPSSMEDPSMTKDIQQGEAPGALVTGTAIRINWQELLSKLRQCQRMQTVGEGPSVTL